MEDDVSGEYATFLHSLDNDELLEHVHSLATVDSDVAENSIPLLQPSDRFNLLPSQAHNFEPLLRSSSFQNENLLFQKVFPELGLHLARIPSQNHAKPNPALSAQNTFESHPSKPDCDEISTFDAPAGNPDPDVNVVAEIAPVPLATGTDDLDESSFDGSLHEFGDYKTYFINKQQKQQKDDAAYVKWDSERRGEGKPEPPQVFEGCLIHVNGYTVPSINEIHRLVILHGGTFLAYLSNKGSATHIICDRLTPKKMVEFRNYRVVKAQWIVDCVESGILQDWKSYRLITEVEYGQGRLQFGSKNTDTGLPIDSEQSQLNALQNSFLDGAYSEPLQDRANGETSQFGAKQPVHSKQGCESDTDASEDEFHLTPLTQVERDEEALVEKEMMGPEALELKPERIMDAKHPDFLQHYFANSRLHHLLTWKADLRLKFLRKLVRESKTKHTQSEGYNNLRRIVLHVDFDCFFAAASCLKHPQYNITTDPIAIAHGTKLSDVASCNYVARRMGVHNGMWVGTAKKHCPSLILLDYDFETYEKVSGEFYNYLESHDTFDSILPVLIDEVLIDASSHFENDYDQLEQAVSDFCAQIRRDILRLTGCSVSVGASENILLAKLSLRQAKPDGLFVLFGEILQFLSQVPIKDLPGVGRHICEKVAHLTGVSKPLVADILLLERGRLISTFGDKTGTKLFEYARGVDETQVALNTSDPEAVFGRKSVSVDVNYGIRFETVPQLDVFFSRLAKELYTRLILLGICGSSLTLKLARRAKGASVISEKHMGLGVVDFFSKSSRLGVATNDYGVISSEMKALYRMLNIPVRDLRGIAVTMSKLLDVDKMSTAKQMRLPFSGNLERVSRPASPQKNPLKPIALPTQTRRDLLSLSKPQTEVTNTHPSLPSGIDAEVFSSLPYSIRRELEKEFKCRGLIPQRPSPTKRHLTGRTFMQQLIPSQLGAPPKYMRVADLPTKNSGKRSNPVSPLKIAKVQSPTHHYSDSLDSLVLEELPTFIRDQVLKDEKQRKLSKSLAHKPLKERFILANGPNSFVKVMTLDWIKQQTLMSPTPPFLNKRTSLSQIKKDLEGWIETSLQQGGPHMDDVEHIVHYMLTLLKDGYLARALLLIKFMNSTLAYCETILGPNPGPIAGEGISDWNRVLDHSIRPRILEYCGSQNLVVVFPER